MNQPEKPQVQYQGGEGEGDTPEAGQGLGTQNPTGAGQILINVKQGFDVDMSFSEGEVGLCFSALYPKDPKWWFRAGSECECGMSKRKTSKSRWTSMRRIFVTNLNHFTDVERVYLYV